MHAAEFKILFFFFFFFRWRSDEAKRTIRQRIRSKTGNNDKGKIETITALRVNQNLKKDCSVQCNPS